MEALRTLRLVLNSRFVLDIKSTFYVLSFPRNLVSIFKLINIYFGFHFDNSVVSIFRNKSVVGIGFFYEWFI